jgi:hypothetical protein
MFAARPSELDSEFCRSCLDTYASYITISQGLGHETKLHQVMKLRIRRSPSEKWDAVTPSRKLLRSAKDLPR